MEQDRLSPREIARTLYRRKRKPIGWDSFLRRRYQSFNGITPIQSLGKTEATGVTSKQSAAFGGQPAAGNNIIVTVVNNTGSFVSSITDTAGGNTWNHAIQKADALGQVAAEVWYAFNINTTASFKITVNLTGTGTVVFGAEEFDSSLSTDGSNSNAPGVGSFTPSTGSLAPISGQNNDLAVICLATNASGANAITEAASFTTMFQEAGAGFINSDGAYQVLTSSASINPQWTLNLSSTYTAVIAMFKPAATSGAVMAGHRGGSAGALEMWMEAGLL